MIPDWIWRYMDRGSDEWEAELAADLNEFYNEAHAEGLQEGMKFKSESEYERGYCAGEAHAFREAAREMRDLEDASFNEGYDRGLNEGGNW